MSNMSGASLLLAVALPPAATRVGVMVLVTVSAVLSVLVLALVTPPAAVPLPLLVSESE